jgi:hypothetical protein
VLLVVEDKERLVSAVLKLIATAGRQQEAW